MSPLVAEILGPDLLVILAVVAVLFGGSQIPKLARSLGSASHEFRRGLEEGTAAPAEEPGPHR
jgi:sec-independent protein translocase protein TatA